MSLKSFEVELYKVKQPNLLDLTLAQQVTQYNYMNLLQLFLSSMIFENSEASEFTENFEKMLPEHFQY